MMANWLIASGAFLFFILGALHFRMTVADMKTPKKFAPAKPGLLEELQNTRMAFRPDLKSFWQTYIGFHFSHSIGILFYAFILIYGALVRPDMFADIYLRMAIVLFGASYVLLSKNFWFHIPLIGSMLGVTLIAIGMAMLA